ncbi:MAG: beta-ketoacyl-ACP synthase II [Deltaproteobacteria bacterium]|nr:beta-ketoacyl-ACP synthase II [Deltaproteobacteria bacterium]
MKRRVVVTGLGAVTPVGNSMQETWDNLCRGRSGIAGITKFDCTKFETRIAGELKNFDASAYVNKKELRRFDDYIIYCLAAAEMALADAQLAINDSNGERTGVIIGTAIGGIETIEKEKEILMQSGPKRVSPFTIPSAIPNLGAGHVAIRFGAKGPISCPATACSSGNNAIGDSFRAIAGGYADVMIAGGAEAAISPLAVSGFNAMRAISLRNDKPEKASRPFDLNRDGFVMSEGCGLLILEELTHALNRGTHIYAELAGYGMTCDAFHFAQPPAGHEGAARCMKAALLDAGMTPGDIQYINAHGTSTSLNDRYETEAIKTTFGELSKTIPASSTKSMIGHMLGAAGGVEALITAKVIEEGLIPPTINLDDPDPSCDLDYVPHQARERQVTAAMSNSFGFGGVNTVIILKKFQG